MRYLTMSPLNMGMTRLGSMFNAFDDLFDEATLPEDGTIITKSRMVTDKYRVKYDEDGVIKLEPVKEEENDTTKS